jgi:RNA polymerase sigma factor (TIGR02999 family)
MEDPQPSETIQLLQAWAKGDKAALERLTPRVYRELRRLAGYQMRNERPGKSLQATELVHEAYFRLVDVKNVEWTHRAHFLAVAAAMMRHILLDRARKRVTAKRGGAAPKINFNMISDVGSSPARELIALDDALLQLAAVDERKARVVEMRFFGGLTVEETAEALGVSSDTVERDWKMARAWLHTELSPTSARS